MSNYKQAVDLLEDYLEATQPIQNDFPGMETNLQYAIKILKMNPQYGDFNIQ
ncbi:MAG: hypothetical protein ACRCST_04340 [Turicibacter sp.]